MLKINPNKYSQITIEESWYEVQNYKLTRNDVKNATYLLFVAVVAWLLPLVHWWAVEFDMGFVWVAIFFNLLTVPHVIDIIVFKRWFSLRMLFLLSVLMRYITTLLTDIIVRLFRIK